MARLTVFPCPPGLFPEVLVVESARFGDERGWFRETYSRRDFAGHGIDAAFVQDNHSYSARPGTVRGLHFQTGEAAQAKLVRVLRGAVLDVVVDIRPGSPTFGRHVAIELDAASGRQLFVPAGFAHGFCTLVPDTEVNYKVSTYYAPESEGGLRWDDAELGIAWPVAPADATVAERDRTWPGLRQFLTPARG